MTGYKRVALVCGYQQKPVDGIADYAQRLQSALEAEGVDARLVLTDRRPGRQWIDTSGCALRGDETIVLQYNPYSFGRFGFAPWLIARVALARLRGACPAVVLMVHEAFTPAKSVRSGLMSIWQRIQLRLLRVAADTTAAPTAQMRQHLEARRPHRPTFMCPVGSNLPDRRELRSSTRLELGVTSDTTVIATFSTPHPSHLNGHVWAALEEVADLSNTFVLHTGTGAPAVAKPPRFGRAIKSLDVTEIARHLAAADIFLAPFADGVSTRRTTLMAALQHGLVVVGTRGPSTDAVLGDATGPLRLVSADDPDVFAAEVRRVLDNRDGLADLSIQARELYEREYSWPRIATKMKRILDDSTPRRRSSR